MDEALLSDLLAREAASEKVPGAQLGLLKGSERVVLCAGSLRVDDSGPVTPSTAFHLGSITKSLTALVVMDAARRRVLDVDVPCAAQVEGLWEETPRSLMTQTTGRRDEFPNEGETLDAFIRRVDGHPRIHPPGRFSYCNAGWFVLDALLRKTSGATFEELARRALGPDTTFGMPRDGAHGHAAVPGRPLEPTSSDLAVTCSAAGGRWWATADQVLDYAALHLSDGAGRFHPDDVRALRVPRVAIPGRTVADGWGLGWAVWARGEHDAFGWMGYMAGHQSFLRCFPTQGAAVVLLTNSAGPMLGGCGGSAMFERLLPHVLAALDVPPLPPPDLASAGHSTESLAGIYDGVVVRAIGKDALWVDAAAWGDPAPARLTRIGGDTFAPNGDHPGALRTAFEDDLLYIGPFAGRRD